MLRQLGHAGEDLGGPGAFEHLPIAVAAVGRCGKTEDPLPAARAAAMPGAASSTTTQAAGSARIARAAWRNRSGAGLPRATMLAE